MSQLGVSVYPDIKPLDEIKKYLELASRYGCKRVFSSMFSVEGTKEEMLAYFKELNATVHAYNMEITLDVNPMCLEKVGATAKDISVFKEIDTDVLRMDLNYGVEEDLQLINNPYDIKIEFNASIIDANYIKELLKHNADPNRILVCHNFYPQRYTGMKWKKFRDMNKEFKETGVTVGAFISSNAENTHGVWNATCGLCTVEKLRGLPIDLQMRELLATDDVDDILIGNAYASEEEFASIQAVLVPFEYSEGNPIVKMMESFGMNDENFKRQKKVKIHLDEGISEVEKDVLFNFFPHSDVGDSSEWIWRSRIPRIVYRDKTIEVRKSDKPMFERGDVVMVNDSYKYYAAEVQIVLQPIENDGQRNLIGCLDDQEIEMLELINDKEIVIFQEKK